MPESPHETRGSEPESAPLSEKENQSQLTPVATVQGRIVSGKPRPGSNSFPRSSRVKLPGHFERARKQGQRVVSGSLIANWLPMEAGAPLRLGVVTGRKVGGAVQRNRARRLMREVFRIHQHEFKRPVDLILVARPSMAGKSLREVEKDFLRALKQGGLLNTNQ